MRKTLLSSLLFLSALLLLGLYPRSATRSSDPGFSALASPTRIVVISDLNGRYGSMRYHSRVREAVNKIIALKPNLVISTGDMVAGLRTRPRLNDDEISAMWAAFHAAVSDPLGRAGIPLAVTPGNHDGSAYEGFQNERAIYDHQWTDRKPPVAFLDDTHYPHDYSFTASGALFISLDATVVGPLPEEQKTWLKAQLRQASAYAVKIIFSHVPLFPFAVGREDEVLRDAELEAILQRYEVDMYLSGHHHAFYSGVKDGIQYVSQGSLGGGPRKLIGNRDTSPRSFTIVTIFDDAHTSIEAYKAPTFDEHIDRKALPPPDHFNARRPRPGRPRAPGREPITKS